MAKKTRVRRTDEQLVADLQAKIAEVKRRAEQKQTKRDPSLRHISAALRSIDKAAAASTDPVNRQALDEARATLSACLSLNGAASKDDVRSQPRRASKVLDADVLLEHIRKNPGQRGEEVAAAMGTETAAMRPLMRNLIDERKVRTKGERRGMRYYSA